MVTILIGKRQGESDGLGKSISLALSKTGADVVDVARSNQSPEQTTQDVFTLRRKALSIFTDVIKWGGSRPW
jgi:NAD(P)-dependent dehydrogenase (short-subunit alcohol dehydrogenase family)